MGDLTQEAKGWSWRACGVDASGHGGMGRPGLVAARACTDWSRRGYPLGAARSTRAYSKHGFPDDPHRRGSALVAPFPLALRRCRGVVCAAGFTVDRSTSARWVQRFLLLFGDAARPQRHPVGRTWRVDEAYIRRAGTWTYIERARRSAEACLRHAIEETGVTPERVTTDTAQWYLAALRVVLPDVEQRCSTLGNTGVECDHQHVKQRL